MHMLDRLPELLESDPALRRRGRHMDTRFLVAVGDAEWLVRVRDGAVTVEKGPFVGRSWSFALRGAADAWAGLWQPVPPPQANDIFALVKHGRMVVEGDLHPFFANLLFIKGLLALPGRVGAAA
jgi:hypothetical protein